jgi:hypothetical protein
MDNDNGFALTVKGSELIAHFETLCRKHNALAERCAAQAETFASEAGDGPLDDKLMADLAENGAALGGPTFAGMWPRPAKPFGVSKDAVSEAIKRVAISQRKQAERYAFFATHTPKDKVFTLSVPEAFSLRLVDADGMSGDFLQLAHRYG